MLKPVSLRRLGVLLARATRHTGVYIFDISRLRSDKKFELYKSGVVKFNDIKDLSKFNASQQIQIKSEISQEQIIDKDAIKEFLDTLRYPLYHLDFEDLSAGGAAIYWA